MHAQQRSNGSRRLRDPKVQELYTIALISKVILLFVNRILDPLI